MKLDKYDRMFIAFMFIVVTIISICNCVNAVEGEEVIWSTVNQLAITSQTNYFIQDNSSSVGYIQLEKGYIYHIYIPSSFSVPRYIALSSEIPTLNGTYQFLSTVQPGDNYSYLSNNNDYLYFNFSSANAGIVVTREKVENMNGAIGDLVDNVGVNQLWGVFESGIDFVGVIVLCAFGFFLVFLLIKKITKGKSDF